MHAAEDFTVPCQPRVLALLMRELVADVANMRRVNQLFGADPVLAGLLLQSANSRALHMTGQVRSIPQAIMLLGERQLRVLLKKAQTDTATRPLARIDMQQFARNSQMCAKLARSFASWTSVDGSTIYMAALLHRVGYLMLHQTQYDRVAMLDKSAGIWDPRRPRLEMKYWGYSANSITAALLCGFNRSMQHTR